MAQGAPGAARQASRVLLAKEKIFTKEARDRPSAARLRVKVERNYVFNGPDGTKSLAELFDERSHECETRAAFVLKEDTHTFTLGTSGFCRAKL
jgi:predicted dithiol-disulfide oxidoreductase (DUF899 family)